ncbi:MAG: hypothetical protein HFACDABA_00660 [Anaerolineales bacterium]|nr:hypothetical protein [Anaerolineales bacterium]
MDICGAMHLYRLAITRVLCFFFCLVTVKANFCTGQTFMTDFATMLRK